MAILAAWNDAPGTGQNRTEAKKRIEDLKRKTKCKACDQVGHWHKDPECPKGNNGPKNETSKPKSTAT